MTHNRESRHRAKIIIALMIIYIVWGSTYLGIRFAIETMPPFWMAGVRFLMAGAALYLIAQWRENARPTARQWFHAMWIGTLMFGAGNGLVSWAEQTVPSGLAALIIGTVPLWMAFMDSAFFRAARPSARVAAGLLAGVIGVGLLIDPRSDVEGAVNPLGAAALLTACLSWSYASLRSRTLDLPKSPFVTAGMQMLGGGLAMLVISTLLGDWSRVRIDEISVKSLVALLYLIIFGSMLALSAFTWLLRNCSISTVSTYAYVNPVIAVVLGAWFGREQLTVRTGIAGGMIVLAVAVIVAQRSRSKVHRIVNQEGTLNAAPVQSARHVVIAKPERCRPLTACDSQGDSR